MSLHDLSRQWPVQALATPDGAISYRRAGRGPRLVLLHGIGSGSGSWLAQWQGLRSSFELLAWDAPGYGQSARLTPDWPSAGDYAQRLWQWLESLDCVDSPLHLVGHSLGCLMAAAATLQHPHRVARLTLLSPAQGYALADESVRQEKLQSRLDSLRRLGPQGMAQRRGAAMLSPLASPEQVAYVQSIMAAIDPLGYSQAARMLAHADLATDLAAVRCEVSVASGSADTVTPPEACQALALRVGAPYFSLGPAGHACALEAAEAVNRLMRGFH
jgi:pimeloyl-ACP methyl ester carboxylesterase